MPIPGRDVAAIAEYKVDVIDRYSRRIYARLQRLFHGDSIDDTLTYEALYNAFLPGLVRTIPVALEFHELCAAIASSQPAGELRSIMDRAESTTRTMAIRTGVILSFDETSTLRIKLESEYSEVRPRDRIIFSLEEADVRAAALREPLRARLLADGYGEDRAAVGSYVLARLAMACKLFLEKLEELLASVSRSRIYAAAAFLFALIIELYARSYECLYVFKVADLG